MKKTAKIYTLIYSVALVLVCAVMLALSACGDAGTTYKFTGAEVSGTGYMASMDSTLKTTYETMYKDSTITVNDKEIIWTVKDAKNVMSVNKDGDKYVLSGEYVEQVGSSLASMGTVPDYEMYGVKTENGFDIVLTMTITVSGMSGSTNVNLNFA